MSEKLECTRCNYELKGTENYCPICGVNLKGTAQEVPVQEQKTFKAKGKCKYPCTLILKTYNG